MFSSLFSFSLYADSNLKEENRKLTHGLYIYLIAERIKNLDLSMLNSKSLPKEDIEIRVWKGFALTPLEGFIFRKRGKNWVGRYVDNDFDANITNLASPQSGWQSFINQIEKLGVYTLPDESELKGGIFGLDRTSYMVEILKGSTYRAYSYHAPSSQPWTEAKTLLAIVEYISNEIKTDSVKKSKN